MNDGFLPMNYKLTQKLGINASMLLSLLIDTQEYYDNKPFYKTQKQVEDRIGLSKHFLLQSKKLLVEEGLITTWLNDNSTPYYFINDECFNNIQKILGVFITPTGGVHHTDRGCMSHQQGVFITPTGGVDNMDTNNNIKKEHKEKKNNNNLEEELSNNNIENLVEEDEADMYINGKKHFTLNPTPSKPKNGIFNNFEI